MYAHSRFKRENVVPFFPLYRDFPAVIFKHFSFYICGLKESSSIYKGET
jgi:hypothetical protein